MYNAPIYSARSMTLALIGGLLLGGAVSAAITVHACTTRVEEGNRAASAALESYRATLNSEIEHHRQLDKQEWDNIEAEIVRCKADVEDLKTPRKEIREWHSQNEKQKH